MSWKHLGETFDIHGGGIDLVFPHHENEIAQSRCAFHTPVMANYWMHNGFLQVEGEKMSKSLGNFITIHQLREGWKGYPWKGEALRFNMLRTNYRQPIDWTFEGLDESHKILWGWYEPLSNISPAPSIPEMIIEALCDDLNTPEMISALHKLHRSGDSPGLLAALNFLGFSGDRQSIARHHVLVAETGHFDVPGPSAPMLVMRANGTAEFDAETKAKIDELINARTAARKARNFAESDRIRDELAAKGIVLKDTKDGTTWEIAR